MDFNAGRRDTGRIGEGQITLSGQRLRGVDLNFPRFSGPVHVQGIEVELGQLFLVTL